MGRPARFDRDTLLLNAEGNSRARTTMTGRSIALFAAAALAEIAGAYLIWVGLREGKGPLAVVAGAFALVLYGLIAAQQPSNEFGRVLAAYGGVFVVGSLLWGVAFDGFQPDHYDLAGVMICLAGVGVIMYGPH
ncbi:MAG TPA: YnfA family protein [Solirubrobacteraceae bacterium]|nr:YnfA family protein [Solirubrobacteraceae bacterium]